MEKNSYFTNVSQGYTSSMTTEAHRLHVQEEFGRELDEKMLTRAYQLLGRTENLIGLDVGCADGYVTQKRLTRDHFTKVIGIDYNENTIRRAREKQEKGFSYCRMDVESADFEEAVRRLMEQEEIPAFDVIYSALTLHHLKDPVRLLRRLNAFLSPKGVLLLRGIDDGAQLFFVPRADGAPDMEQSALLEEITNLSLETPGMSRRLHGRQLYAWLRQAGYREIHSDYAVADTVGRDPEAREDLFQYMLAFRSSYTERAIARDPADAALKRRHEQMTAKLDEIHKILLDNPDAYYMVASFGMAAQKFHIQNA